MSSEPKLCDVIHVARPLSPLEQALLAALDRQFVSTTVVRSRARLMLRDTSPSAARTTLPADQPLAVFHAACIELERRGLAERTDTPKIARWRRVRTAAT